MSKLKFALWNPQIRSFARNIFEMFWDIGLPTKKGGGGKSDIILFNETPAEMTSDKDL